jgi:Cu(I)/Ag(I) efflux system membrane fusion protein
VRAGEEVVVSANFLIDAESNIKAALAGLGAPDTATAKPATSTDNTPAAGSDVSNSAASRPKPIADKAAAPANPGR